jgi:D-alanyl-D-alanine carboxypeptidase
MNRREFLNNTKLGLGLFGASLVLPVESMAAVKADDVYLSKNQEALFNDVRKKIRRVRSTVGFGNFNLITFDEMIKTGKRYSKVGAFTPAEIDFLEALFYFDPSAIGFFGDRTCEKITDKIAHNDVRKIPYSGHYLFKGKVEEAYSRVVKDVGNSVILTSGVRSIVKQTDLFLSKLSSSKGNLSLASRSIAPPGYSYHSIGDFDIGKKGWGYKNFTAQFATTSEFFQMRKLKYIDMRYTIANRYGVRYEPWHIKVI